MGEPTGAQRRLEYLGLLTGCAELALLATTAWTWAQRRVASPLGQPALAAGYGLGAIGFGAILPIGIHAAQQLSGRHARWASILAALATLGGVFIERAVVVFAGSASARRPQDYLRFTQPPRVRGERVGGAR